MDGHQTIRESIITDMSEGVMAIRYNGIIELANDAALAVLEKKREELTGRSFASCFFDDERNDAFAQTVLDAIYEKRRRMESYVSYFCGDQEKQLRVVSSYLRENGKLIGIILVLSDITELNRMRDAVKAMERIRSLNEQLELRNRLLKETFGRYLSDDIVREILDTPDGMKMGGSRRRITIMMSDLRGFTMMCERMEPERLITMLNHYFAEMYEEISRYGGTIIEFLGDGMFIIFGAPTPCEDHASNAVAAAVAMQKRMKYVNEWNEEHGFERLSMGIGINTDNVILGNIGSERRTKYGVMGAAVNLAGRIEGCTTGGQILVSPTTRAAVGKDLIVRSEFSMSFKGVRGEITISEAGGIGGSYGLYLEEEEKKEQDVFRALPVPCPVRFFKMDGKQVEEREYRGELLALSGKRALLKTGGEQSLFDNLRLDIGGELDVKVTDLLYTGEEDKRVLTLTFTALPENFSEWKRNLMP